MFEKQQRETVWLAEHVGGEEEETSKRQSEERGRALGLKG